VSEPYINVPEWDGQPRRCAEFFRLRKGARLVSWWLWTHPIGGEIRCEVDGELVRSQAGCGGVKLFELSEQWKAGFVEKGWTT
jgi:hypothetical protein